MATTTPTNYRVVCTTRMTHISPAGTTHGHIVSVGLGDESQWYQKMTVAQVRAAIAMGNRFYTYSPSTKLWAAVEPWTCCGISTLRTLSDAVTDNNLVNLPLCG
jgi:hypothetical protein